MKVVLISSDCEEYHSDFKVTDAYLRMKQDGYLYVPCYRVADNILAPVMVVDDEWFDVCCYLRDKHYREYRTFHRYISKLMKRRIYWRGRFNFLAERFPAQFGEWAR